MSQCIQVTYGITCCIIGLLLPGTAGAARHAGGRAGHTAEAPAGADFERGVKEAQQGIKDMGQVGARVRMMWCSAT